MASNDTPGLRNPVPVLPLMMLIVIILYWPAGRNAEAGTSYVSMTLLPRYVPTVKLRVEAWVVAPGSLLDQLLMVIEGRPPMNASVMPIRTV